MEAFPPDISKNELASVVSQVQQRIAAAKTSDLTCRHDSTGERSWESLELQKELIRIFGILPKQLQHADEQQMCNVKSYVKALSSLFERVQWVELIHSIRFEQVWQVQPCSSAAAAAAQTITINRLQTSLSVAETAVLLLRMSLPTGPQQPHVDVQVNSELLRNLTAWPGLANALRALLLDADQPLPASALHLLQDLLHVCIPLCRLHAKLPRLLLAPIWLYC